MTLVLCRVDDRLIHGQVVVGWGQPLGIQRIVLADDEVAKSAWEQDLYRMAVPGGLEVVFATVAAAGAQLRRLGKLTTSARRCCWGASRRRRSCSTAAPSVVRKINLGGIHHRPGRVERLPYVYLSPEEHRLLTELAAEGAEIAGQDLPTATPVPLGSMT